MFFKTLCDDMYIALKSFDTQHGIMYAAARQTSQGRQQTYSSIPEQDNTPIHQFEDLIMARPPCLTRGVSMSSKQRVQGPTSYFPVLDLSQDGQDQEDEDLNYTLSQKQTSAYSSIGVLKMMREVSYRPPTDQETGLTLDLLSDINIKLP